MPAAVTQFAEGFPRRAFTVDEILRMQEAGIIGEDENFELIEGEIVPMQAKTHVHELIKSALTLKLARALPDDLWLGIESTMYVSERTFVEPDLVVYRRGMKLEDVKGPDILLAIEVALTRSKQCLARRPNSSLTTRAAELSEQCDMHVIARVGDQIG